MARIQFDGQGSPIPPIALPPFGSDEDVPATMLTFTESADFSVEDYRRLGFTHYEVTCVGAAGGRGGDAASELFFGTEQFRLPVPQEVWNLWIEATRHRDVLINSHPVTGYVHPYDVAIYSVTVNGVQYNNVSVAQIEELTNPRHLLTFQNVKQVVLRPTAEAMGGGGGGGGLHRITGELAGLPDVVPIVVGKSGADSPIGQTRVPGVWTPDLYTLSSGPEGPYGGTAHDNIWEGGTVLTQRGLWYINTSFLYDIQVRYRDIMNYLDAYLNSYPYPRASFLPPQPGEDGGASAFASVARASGGMGGSPGRVYTGVTGPYQQTGYEFRGNGGDGGVGDRLEPGGGGKGSIADGVNGSDGIWRPELGTGEGGGGGKGGRQTRNVGLLLSTAGGNGSYSFVDASKYGPRQGRVSWQLYHLWSKSRLRRPDETIYTYLDTQTTLFPTGEIELRIPSVKLDDRPGAPQAQPAGPILVIPGGGGGARPQTNLKYGSDAPGFSPDGVVVLRLMRII